MDSHGFAPDKMAKGLGILMTIPLVLFALWGEYFLRGIHTAIEEKEKILRVQEIDKVRIIAFCILIFQFSLYLGSHSVRKTNPYLWSCLFGVAFLIQGLIQVDIERKIAKSLSEFQEKLMLRIRTFLSTVVVSAIYIGTTFLSTLFFFTIAKSFSFTPVVGTLLTVIGILAGIIVSIVLSFELASYQLKWTIPHERLHDHELDEFIKNLFIKSCNTVPSISILHSKIEPTVKIAVTGFRSRFSFFKINLFISKRALEVLTKEELKGVLLHEISHLQLNHSKKKILFTSALLMGFLSLCSFATLLSYLMFSEKILSELVALMTTCLATLFVVHQSILQSRIQEVEADIHSIEKLEGDLTHLSQALVKLDRLEWEDPTRLSAEPIAITHPRTRRRIEILNRYFSSNQKQGVDSKNSEDTQKAA